MEKKQHIPKPGTGNKWGFSYCGKWTPYLTADHELIRRQVYGDPARHCKRCLAKFNPALLAEAKRIDAMRKEAK